MSVSPTMGPVSPLAMVEIMSFGKPIGSASLMTVTAIEVPPEPPCGNNALDEGFFEE